MPFQQELWLIIVGLVVAIVLRRTAFPNSSLASLALWASLFSLIVGELGMLSTLFFPSDLLGLIVTTFAAMMGARFGAKRVGSSSSSSKSSNSSRSRANKK